MKNPQGDFTGDKFSIICGESCFSQKGLSGEVCSNSLSRIKKETKIAKSIQNKLLPKDDTHWNTITFNSLYLPVDDLGGDFYDLLKLSDDEFIIYIADVSGHGIHSAMLMVFMRERVRTNIDAAAEGTAELLLKTVQDFCALGFDNTMYVTMALCKYTKSRHELSFSNAGHNCFPFIMRNKGGIDTIYARGVPICNIAAGTKYETETVEIKPGDRLVLFTDGIVETENINGRPFGQEGLKEFAGKYYRDDGSCLARKIMDESDRYLCGAKDDRSIIIADILC